MKKKRITNELRNQQYFEDKKMILLDKSNAYEHELNTELQKAQINLSKTIKIVTIGVGLATTILLLLGRRGRRKEKSVKCNLPAKTNYKNSIFQQIKKEIALFLINIARQKLIEFLKNKETKQEKDEKK